MGFVRLLAETGWGASSAGGSKDNIAVKRIVANIATEHTASARAFHGDILGMEVAMHLGWTVTFAAGKEPDARRASST